MKRIQKALLALAVVLAVNVPVAASLAGPVTDSCQALNAEAAKWGWHGDTCILPDPDN